MIYSRYCLDCYEELYTYIGHDAKLVAEHFATQFLAGLIYQG